MTAFTLRYTGPNTPQTLSTITNVLSRHKYPVNINDLYLLAAGQNSVLYAHISAPQENMKEETALKFSFGLENSIKEALFAHYATPHSDNHPSNPTLQAPGDLAVKVRQQPIVDGERHYYGMKLSTSKHIEVLKEVLHISREHKLNVEDISVAIDEEAANLVLSSQENQEKEDIMNIFEKELPEYVVIDEVCSYGSSMPNVLETSFEAAHLSEDAVNATLVCTAPNMPGVGYAVLKILSESEGDLIAQIHDLDMISIDNEATFYFRFTLPKNSDVKDMRLKRKLYKLENSVQSAIFDAIYDYSPDDLESIDYHKIVVRAETYKMSPESNDTYIQICYLMCRDNKPGILSDILSNLPKHHNILAVRANKINDSSNSQVDLHLVLSLSDEADALKIGIISKINAQITMGETKTKPLSSNETVVRPMIRHWTPRVNYK